MAAVQAAIEHIFPLVYEFRKERSKEELEALAKKKFKQGMHTDVDPAFAGKFYYLFSDEYNVP